jgi:hypothetical protein
VGLGTLAILQSVLMRAQQASLRQWVAPRAGATA